MPSADRYLRHHCSHSSGSPTMGTRGVRSSGTRIANSGSRRSRIGNSPPRRRGIRAQNKNKSQKSAPTPESICLCVLRRRRRHRAFAKRLRSSRPRPARYRARVRAPVLASRRQPHRPQLWASPKAQCPSSADTTPVPDIQPVSAVGSDEGRQDHDGTRLGHMRGCVNTKPKVEPAPRPKRHRERQSTAAAPHLKAPFTARRDAPAWLQSKMRQRDHTPGVASRTLCRPEKLRSPGAEIPAPAQRARPEPVTNAPQRVIGILFLKTLVYNVLLFSLNSSTSFL